MRVGMMGMFGLVLGIRALLPETSLGGLESRLL
jgi:hypothetical protein